MEQFTAALISIIENLLLENKIEEAKNTIFAELNKPENVENAELYSLLGKSYAIEGENSLALQYFSKAYQLEPKNSEIVMSICNFLLANGKHDEATQLMDEFYQNQNLSNNIKNIEVTDEEDFSYFDFILGDEDALTYKQTPAEEIIIKNDFQLEENFSYFDLLLGETPAEENVEIEEQIPSKILATAKENIIVTSVEKSKPQSKLLFTMYGWNESGGGTTFPKAFIKELAKRGFSVAVFYATAKHETIKTPYYMEHSLDEGVELYGIYNRPTILFDADEPLREIKDDKIATLFSEVIAEFKPNIVNFHNFLGLSFELANIAQAAGLPTTYTPYNYHLIDPNLYMYNSDLSSWKNTDFFQNSQILERYPTLREQYLQRAEAARFLLTEKIDYTFAVSSRVKEILTEFVGENSNFSNRICVINQVHITISDLLQNPTAKHFIEQEIHFVFLGAVMPRKGVHIIAQAAQLLTSKNVHFDIYGFCVADYDTAIKSVDKFNLITLHGRYNSNDLRKIAENANVAILPSLWEDCAPFVITEYLSMGLPVIASNIGGVTDFIKEGYNGSYFQVGSPRALASVLQALIDNPFKIEKMRENCKINMKFEDYVEHKIKIYERLISGEKPPAEEFELRF